MVGIRDIAKRAEMQPSTVLWVMTGKTNVNSEKRGLILKLIEETGYAPDKAARGMVTRRSFATGGIIPDMFNVFQRRLFSIRERHLISFGRRVLFFRVKPDMSSERDCITRLKEERIEGIIMPHEMKSREFYRYPSVSKVPAISVIVNTAGRPAITVDGGRAAADAVKRRIGLGHKNIDMIGGCGFFSFGFKRVEGYREALGSTGRSFTVCAS